MLISLIHLYPKPEAIPAIATVVSNPSEPDHVFEEKVVYYMDAAFMECFHFHFYQTCK